MIDVEVEDEAWSSALPSCEAVVLTAAKTTLQFLSRWERGTDEVGGEGLSASGPSEGPLRRGASPHRATSPNGGGLVEDDLTILLTDDETVRDLNARFRSKDSATNVLSFPAHDTAQGHLGDIAMAYGVCAREASEQNKPLAAHLQHLVAHGVLHLVGYDHEDDAEAEVMEDLERQILATLGLPDPYAETRLLS